MVSNHSKTFPEKPRGPDALVEAGPRWPKQDIVPLHDLHPVTGEKIG